MVDGRTLIMKGKNKATLVENYRPIACLNFSWKLLTGIFAETTYLYHLVSKLLQVMNRKGVAKVQGAPRTTLSLIKLQCSI